MKMIGLCCLTNYASGISKSELTHDEVVDTAKNYQQNFLNLLDIFKIIGTVKRIKSNLII